MKQQESSLKEVIDNFLFTVVVSVFLLLLNLHHLLMAELQLEAVNQKNSPSWLSVIIYH